MAPISISISVIFMFHSFLYSQARFKYFLFFFFFLRYFSLCGLLDLQSSLDNKFFSGWLKCFFMVGIRWFVCIFKFRNILCIFKNRLWFMIISIVRTVIFQSLAQFSVDHLVISVIHFLVFLLCSLVAFSYYVIKRFISITIFCSLAIFLSITSFVLILLLLLLLLFTH